LSIPDIPQPSEISGQTTGGLKYRIDGTIQQTLLVDLEAGQTIVSDAGGMSWMTRSVAMNTRSSGGIGGLLKRAVSGATLFLVDFTAQGSAGHVAFSADFPGKVLPIELVGSQTVIMHKHAFMCAEQSVTLDIFFNRRLGAGLFAGEGFVLQKLTGPGAVFAELDGDAIEYHLKPGEAMRVEPGHVAMFDASISFDIEMIKGFTNILMGGEGLFLATLTGPGRIWLHSLTPSKVAHRVAEYLPGKG
jgi:uncharacterized protein (TIGR00266 family)